MILHPESSSQTFLTGLLCLFGFSTLDSMISHRFHLHWPVCPAFTGVVLSCNFCSMAVFSQVPSAAPSWRVKSRYSSNQNKNIRNLNILGTTRLPPLGTTLGTFLEAQFQFQINRKISHCQSWQLAEATSCGLGIDGIVVSSVRANHCGNIDLQP